MKLYLFFLFQTTRTGSIVGTVFFSRFRSRSSWRHEWQDNKLKIICKEDIEMLYSIKNNLCHYLLSFACNKFLKMRVTIRRRTRRPPSVSRYFITYKLRCLILQTIPIHIPLNDMYKSHKIKTNSFDSRFR